MNSTRQILVGWHGISSLDEVLPYWVTFKAWVRSAGEDSHSSPELGDEAFTYRLDSGVEDSVHLDAVLEVNQDSGVLQDSLLHRLTVEALSGLKESGLGKRQVARQLGTSASQLYRLLDPENRAKSLGQMLALLHLVDREVDLVVKRKESVFHASDGVCQVYCDKGGSFRFRFKNDDGRVVLKSAAYRSKGGCLRAIKSVRANAVHESLFEREKTKTGRFQFRLRSKNHHVIGKSPAYHSAAQRDAALGTVRRKAARVRLEEVAS